MTNLINILLGLQIGFQLIAVYYAIRIKSFKNTPSSVYTIAAIALFLMSVTRADIIFSFNLLSPLVRVLIQSAISVLWMTFFIKVFLLIRKQHE